MLLGTPNGPLCKLLAMAACSGPRLFQNASMRTNLYTQQTTHGSLLTDLARAVPPVQNCIDMPGKFAPPSSCWSQLRWHARWIMQKRSATVPCRRNSHSHKFWHHAERVQPLSHAEKSLLTYLSSPCMKSRIHPMCHAEEILFVSCTKAWHHAEDHNAQNSVFHKGLLPRSHMQ